MRDVAAFNKIELLPWDGWGLIEASDDALSDGDVALLDQVAELTALHIPDTSAIRHLYKSDARLTMPGKISSHTDEGVAEVLI